MKTLPVCLLVILAGCSATKQETPAAATIFEGARLIADGSTVVDNSAFVIENAKITTVGRKGEMTAPAEGFGLAGDGKPTAVPVARRHRSTMTRRVSAL